MVYPLPLAVLKVGVLDSIETSKTIRFGSGSGDVVLVGGDEGFLLENGGTAATERISRGPAKSRSSTPPKLKELGS